MNIDKELIAMCDTPEIQDRWEPKVGDRVWSNYEGIVHKGVPTPLGEGFIKDVRPHPDNDEPGFSAIAVFKHFSTEKAMTNKMFIYIPRIEDVLEWLGKGIQEIRFNHETKAVNLMLCQDMHRFHGAIIPALLKAYMHLEHNKTWDGEIWTKS